MTMIQYEYVKRNFLFLSLSNVIFFLLSISAFSSAKCRRRIIIRM